jgi:hypothetical protein
MIAPSEQQPGEQQIRHSRKIQRVAAGRWPLRAELQSAGYTGKPPWQPNRAVSNCTPTGIELLACGSWPSRSTDTSRYGIGGLLRGIGGAFRSIEINVIFLFL